MTSFHIQVDAFQFFFQEPSICIYVFREYVDKNIFLITGEVNEVDGIFYGDG